MKFETEDFKIDCNCDENKGVCFHTKMAEIKALVSLVRDCGDRVLDKVMTRFEEGWSGWDDEERFPPEAIIKRLEICVEKEEWVNAIAYAMFLMNQEDE